MALDHFMAGEAAFVQKNKAKSIKEFEAALRLEAGHYWSLMWLGYCLSDLGMGPADYNAAAVAYTGCILKRPGYAHAHYCRANTYVKLGRFEEALADYCRAIDLGARRPAVWFDRGNAYLGLKRLGEAITDYSTAIALDPKYAKAWCARAAVYGKQGHWQKCLGDASRAIALDPGIVNAWRIRAFARAKLGQWQGVADDCTRAIKLDPGNIPTRDRRAYAYVQLRRWREAIDEYSTVLKQAPERANAWCVRGYAYEQLKQWEAAKRDYARATELAPDVVAWRNLASVETRLGHWAEAVAAYSRALALEPGHRPTRTARAYAHAVLGEWKRAADDLDPGDLKRARLDDTWFQLACLRLLQGERAGYHLLRTQLLLRITLTKSGFRGSVAALASRTCMIGPEGGTKPAEAIPWAEKAVESQPGAAGPRHVLALAHYRADQFEKAAQRCRESLKSDPRWQGAVLNRLVLALAHHRLGQPEEASRYFQQVARWRETASRGSATGGASAPPDLSLSNWLEFQVLYREAERLFGQPGQGPSPAVPSR
jgi:tetratricopeptide (TPR) repeat protein